MRQFPKKKALQVPRKQQTSKELVGTCLAFLQRKFYPENPNEFNQDRQRLMKWVVLYPAKWLNERGVTIPPDKYREIFQTVMMDALTLGNTGKIDYLPAWLAKVIQSHFSHHGDEYYEEAKSLRENAILKGLLTGQIVPVDRPADPVREMAQAAALIRGKTKVSKRPVNDQLSLL